MIYLKLSQELLIVSCLLQNPFKMKLNLIEHAILKIKFDILCSICFKENVSKN